MALKPCIKKSDVLVLLDFGAHIYFGEQTLVRGKTFKPAACPDFAYTMYCL